MAVAELEPPREGVPPRNCYLVAVHPVPDIGAERRHAKKHGI